jgi:hypothetical protein
MLESDEMEDVGADYSRIGGRACGVRSIPRIDTLCRVYADSYCTKVLGRLDIREQTTCKCSALSVVHWFGFGEQREFHRRLQGRRRHLDHPGWAPPHLHLPPVPGTCQSNYHTSNEGLTY